MSFSDQSISGTVANQTTAPTTPIDPFSGVAIGSFGASGVESGNGQLSISYGGTTTTFTYDGRVDTYTVQASGFYYIDAFGAQGGAGAPPSSATNLPDAPGGKGAEVGGWVFLIAGDVLDIAVGGVGGYSGPGFNDLPDIFGAIPGGADAGGGGGGGGTFLFDTTTNTLLAAAGGVAVAAIAVSTSTSPASPAARVSTTALAAALATAVLAGGPSILTRTMGARTAAGAAAVSAAPAVTAYISATATITTILAAPAAVADFPIFTVARLAVPVWTRPRAGAQAASAAVVVVAPMVGLAAAAVTVAAPAGRPLAFPAATAVTAPVGAAPLTSTASISWRL